MKSSSIKKYGILALVVVLAIVSLFSCTGGKKDTAMDFANAMLSDFNAKKMVSLMSEEYMEAYMSQMDAQTKKILITKLNDKFKTLEEECVNEYGKHWKIKIKYIDTYKLDDDTVAVSLSVTYKGSGGFLGLTDKEDTEEMTIGLTKERGKWKVCDWEYS